MKNLKAFMIGLAAGALAVGTASTAYAGFTFDFSKSETTSETTTVKDSLENEYEVTHTTETVDDETNEYYEGVPIEVYNETADEMVALYIANTDADNWGDNWFDYIEEGYVLKSDYFVCGLIINYSSKNPTVDIRFDTADGSEITFDEIDLTEVGDPTHIILTIYVDEESGDYKLSYK